MANRPTEIIVSGDMIREAFFANLGTIRIYRKDDRSGGFARKGKHTNFGYSGYYLASIFDGNSWRKLQFNKLIPYEDRYYQTASQCTVVEENLRRRISAWRGLIASYDPETKSFRIYSQEIC